MARSARFASRQRGNPPSVAPWTRPASESGHDILRRYGEITSCRFSPGSFSARHRGLRIRMARHEEPMGQLGHRHRHRHVVSSVPSGPTRRWFPLHLLCGSCGRPENGVAVIPFHAFHPHALAAFLAIQSCSAPLDPLCRPAPGVRPGNDTHRSSGLFHAGKRALDGIRPGARIRVVSTQPAFADHV